MSEPKPAAIIQIGETPAQAEQIAGHRRDRYGNDDGYKKKTLTSYISTFHWFAVDPNAEFNTPIGKCMNPGCKVDASDNTMERFCCGNKRCAKTPNGKIIEYTLVRVPVNPEAEKAEE